jgi:hypothetical protein
MKCKIAVTVVIFVFSFFCTGFGQEQQRVHEEVEVVNIEVPVRVFLKGQLVGGLKKENFKLLLNGKEHPINAFFEIRRKIGTAAGEGQTTVQAARPRLFVLMFNISDYNIDLQKNIDYFFKAVIRTNDRLMVLTNNFFLNDYVVKDVKRERKRIKKILQIEARRIKLELTHLRSKLRSLMEDREDRSEERSLNNRYFVRDFVSYLKGFKRTYLTLNSEQYLEIARHLKKQKVDKWVFNFFQTGMFYYPRMLETVTADLDQGNEDVQWETAELLELYQAAYKELQGVDKRMVEDISKFFLNTEASFHTQLMRNKASVVLDGYNYQPISLNTENVFTEAAKMTGGSVLRSNKIEKFVEKITASEDIYYLLTYNPGPYKGKNQKLKVVVSDEQYRAIYDDLERKRYLEAAAKKAAKEESQIAVQKLSFREGLLAFTISNIKLVPAQTGNTKTGTVLVRIKIMDSDSKILYGRERKFSFPVKEQEIKIRKLPPLKKGMYDIMVEVHDLNTGRNDIAIEDVRIRR